VLYDDASDRLKTFVNSTRSGVAIQSYEFPLKASASLGAIAASGTPRVIDDIKAVVRPNSPHSNWLLEQGYRSSLTVPLTDQGHFIGLLFYDACQLAAFTPMVQRNLALFSRLINMTISNELSAVRSIMASTTSTSSTSFCSRPCTTSARSAFPIGSCSSRESWTPRNAS